MLTSRVIASAATSPAWDEEKRVDQADDDRD